MSTNPNRPKLRWLILLLASVMTVWSLSGLVLHSMSDRGTFGDMFGAVNALFSGLAFATLIYTAWMQREELSLQRRELEMTREEMRGQKEAIRAQNETFMLQRFETTFFELLRVHGQIVDSIDLVDNSNRATKPRDCFCVFYRRLRKAFLAHLLYPKDEQALQIAKEIYGSFYEEHQEELGHYFRHLYHIIKFVKSSDVQDKKRYTNFVRAQLSSYELALLFYNGVSDLGEEKFKPLIEEFSLLKNLPETLILRPTTHSGFYAPGAYGKTAL